MTSSSPLPMNSAPATAYSAALVEQDILVLTAAGTVDLGALDMFTGIERIKTSAAGNTVTGAHSTQPTVWFGQSGADDLTGAAVDAILCAVAAVMTHSPAVSAMTY